MNGEEHELRIPSVQRGVDLVGILHRNPGSNGTQPRRIALILHGLLAHKNQCYHKQLAQALPIDSCRFDFRGNGDSGGDWTMGDLGNDVQDLSTVVSYLHRKEGYVLDLIVGHSRGSMISWMYLGKGEKKLQEDGGRSFVPNLVVCSGRWDMQKVLETYASFQEGFDREGFYRWQITSAGKKKEYIVWPKDLKNMSAFKYPTEFVAALSTNTDVLILHGTADRTVFEQDAHSYLAALDSNKKRRRNSHRLHLIEGADHMYRGRTQPVVDEICEWYAERQRSVADNGAPSTSRL
ncbi:hypothetical protein NDA13_005682 [Ustilago tritici]|nr:hypothetical protein NDA13_005682 [Ustilago tritici]